MCEVAPIDNIEDDPNATIEDLRREMRAWRRDTSAPRSLVEGELCCVCLETLGFLTKTSCQHVFHKTCFYALTEHDTYTTTCPVCRSRVIRACNVLTLTD